MKKLKVTTICLLSVLFLTSMAFGQITGTAHDFSGVAWNASDEICIVCHTPHNAVVETNAPLWNHTSTTATYTLYTSTTLDATVAAPDGSSKMCMSCHDGTVAYDSFGGATGVTSATGGALIGTDISDDHPVSFTYDAALAGADGELFDPTTEITDLGGTISNDLLLGGKMQCASCHDVHGTGNASLLHIANTNSALCLTCHNK